MKQQREFKAGDKVVIVSGGWNHHVVRRGEVDRVYKSGNFILKNDTQRSQWRQSGYPAGRDSWSRNYLLHADDPSVTEIEHDAFRRKTTQEIEDLAGKLRRAPDSGTLDQLRALRNMLIQTLGLQER